jgi:uncharacterized phage protein (TIGR01671 family)
MRDFRCKAWDTKNKVMYPSAIIDVSGNIVGIFEGEKSFFEAGRAELLQYIGRIDDNDNEMCEGDVIRICSPKQQVQTMELVGELRYSDYGSYKICNIKTIKWEGFSFGIEPPEYIWLLNLVDRKIEIIGNIYENPELLK